MFNNKNKSWYEILKERERNEDKRRSFAQMYGESAILKADYAELEAKCAETAEFTVKQTINVQSDHKAASSQSLQEYLELKHRTYELLDDSKRKGKIDPNQAFKEHKAGKSGFKLTIEDIL